LKTGSLFESDKIIIHDLKLKKKIEYEFTPGNIEKDSLWISMRIPSLLDNCCPKSFISRFHDGQIYVLYQFPTNRSNTFKMDSREIRYKLDIKTAKLLMVEVNDLKK
jgi:hypothetical protein